MSEIEWTEQVDKPYMLVMNRATWYECRQDYKQHVSYGWNRHTGKRLRFFGGIRVYLRTETPTGKIFPFYPPKWKWELQR